MFIDTHTHFDITIEETKVNENTLIQSLKENNISNAIQISIDPDGFQWSYDFSKKNEGNGILFSLGIHPNSKASKLELEKLSDFIIKVKKSNDQNLLFGIGECGLDYFREHQTKKMQQESFIKQIEIAKEHNLPIIIHSREAFEDTINILKETKISNGIFHCFPGNKKMAKQALDLGFHLSFAGNLTFKKATELHESAKYVPLDRLFLETDAPYLTPIPHRGKKNRSEYVIHTYEFISNLREEKLSKIEDAINDNFLQFIKNRG